MCVLPISNSGLPLLLASKLISIQLRPQPPFCKHFGLGVPAYLDFTKRWLPFFPTGLSTNKVSSCGTGPPNHARTVPTRPFRSAFMPACRLAAHPPIQHPPLPRDAANTGTRDRLAPSPCIADPRDTRDSLDDPATLIAMANALRATQPARPTHPPAAGFDWTSQLSHRRVTDAPDAFTH